MTVRKQLYEWTLKGLGAFDSDDYPKPGKKYPFLLEDTEIMLPKQI